MLEALKDNKKTVGIKQSIKALENGEAKVVFIAKDADEKVIGRIKDLCNADTVEVVYVENMKQLGKACSIEVGAAAACILK